jgi:predicted GNAT family acetyltransferase
VASDVDVVRNDDLGRFEAVVDGETAFVTFRRDGDRIVLIHTEVPDRLEGRGVGSSLVRGALENARANGYTIVPQCPFVREFLERHPDEAKRLKLESP